MTKGFAPILKLAVKSQAKRPEKRQLTPQGEIQANLFIELCSRTPGPQSSKNPKTLIKTILRTVFKQPEYHKTRLKEG